MPPFSPGKRVVVLGAGATRGATTSAGRLCQPPLNADFFTQLQRISNTKHRQTVRDVVKDVVAVFGSNFALTMEEYFTQLEAIGRMARLARATGPALSTAEVIAQRDRLMAALAAVLEESTDVSKKSAPSCEHHRAIVNHLQPRDTVISFNYDCVMDHALRQHGQSKWSAKYGYGFQKPSRIDGHDRWDAPDPPTKAGDSIYLLKLHGSINWQLPTVEAEVKPIVLKERLYAQNGTPRFTIIPPEWIKNIDDANFRVLWTHAERAIRNAEQIAFVGFSFTPTDLHVEALFRIALAKQNKLRELIIANPSQDHRRRIRSVFAKPLEGGLLLRQYDDLAQFAQHLDTDGW